MCYKILFYREIFYKYTYARRRIAVDIFCDSVYFICKSESVKVQQWVQISSGNLPWVDKYTLNRRQGSLLKKYWNPLSTSALNCRLYIAQNRIRIVFFNHWSFYANNIESLMIFTFFTFPISTQLPATFSPNPSLSLLLCSYIQQYAFRKLTLVLILFLLSSNNLPEIEFALPCS